MILCSVLISYCVCRRPSWKPKTQPNESSAVVWLSFWFSTRFTGKTFDYSSGSYLYTFYSVRWATQKGDILGVRAQKVAQLRGGGQIFVFRACVAQLVWPSSKYRWGGDSIIFFSNCRSYQKRFSLVCCNSWQWWLAIAVFTSTYRYICQKYHPYVIAILCFFPTFYNSVHSRFVEKRLKYPLPPGKCKNIVYRGASSIIFRVLAPT